MVASLHDSSPPISIQFTEKTTIKNGNIIRERIWRDQWGHEYDRVDAKFHRKVTAAAKVNSALPTAEELFWLGYMACVTFFLLLSSMFLWGFLVGRYAARKRSVHSLLSDELSG